MDEKIYTVQEVATKMGWSCGTIRNLFRNDPQVERLVGPGVILGTAKQTYVTLRIPESAVIRVSERLRQPLVKVRLPHRKPLQVVHLRDKRKKAA